MFGDEVDDLLAGQRGVSRGGRGIDGEDDRADLPLAVVGREVTDGRRPVVGALEVGGGCVHQLLVDRAAALGVLLHMDVRVDGDEGVEIPAHRSLSTPGADDPRMGYRARRYREPATATTSVTP